MRQHNWKEGLIARKGYRRMLLSYLPLVLISISAVVFISFIAVTDMMTREAERADTVAAKHVVNTIEEAAHDIESTVLHELAVNRALYQFMNASSDDNMRLIQYELSKDLNKLAEDYPVIQSMYVYKAADGMVLTLQEITPLSNFPDKEFIAAHFPSTSTENWLRTRLYTDDNLKGPVEVISLIERFPLPLGTEGIVVVNVNVDKLIGLTEDMRSDDLSNMEIRDSRTGTALYATGVMQTDGAQSEVQNQEKYTFQHQSDYLGWTFYSGIKEGSLFAWVSVISYIWITIGIFIFLATVFASIYIFKRNYRPVELLLSQIQQFPLQHLPKQKAADEFAYIEKALEILLETNRRHEERQQEDWMLGKRQFIRDWLEGESASLEQWNEKAAQFEIPTELGACTVLIVELQHDLEFQQLNEELDQRVLKFSLANVVREQWPQQGHLELEWTGANRLAVIWLHEVGFLSEETQDDTEPLYLLARWIKKHLGISIRIGVGQSVPSIAAARVSYSQANDTLRYKLTHDKVILYDHTINSTSHAAFTYYRHLAECLKHLHTMNEIWREQMDTILAQMQEDRLADEQIYAIIDYTAMLLLEEVESVTLSEVKRKLREQVGAMQEKVRQEKDFSGVSAVFTEHLERFNARYCAYKKSNKYQETITRVKRYIEEHYTDPDLSLTQISDKFSLKPKYASQLFKEEFGMKFVDFLLTLRMEEAKKRLLETDDSVQDIALQIGYATPISFGRMFKKMEGVSPGEYRKMKNSQSAWSEKAVE